MVIEDFVNNNNMKHCRRPPSGAISRRVGAWINSCYRAFLPARGTDADLRKGNAAGGRRRFVPVIQTQNIVPVMSRGLIVSINESITRQALMSHMTRHLPTRTLLTHCISLDRPERARATQSLTRSPPSATDAYSTVNAPSLRNRLTGTFQHLA
ncbi:hypothetical protein EVAR_87930_1 [Eumeta japonica]|uniref:Uncharacterized protein n=1 Tax=Eumeta variegata TaxID=151549 RepID=A0A4C1WXV4_EUMVA|nr:hypothetical protein EVAR_87930_1 [Eumeta japonica]